MNEQTREMFERNLRGQGFDESKLAFNGVDYPDPKVNVLFTGYMMAVDDFSHAVCRLVNPPGTKPTSDDIVALRLAAGDSQTQAAERIYSPLRSWQAFENNEYVKGMPPALWELYQMKVSLLLPAKGADIIPAKNLAISTEVDP